MPVHTCILIGDLGGLSPGGPIRFIHSADLLPWISQASAELVGICWHIPLEWVLMYV